MLATDIGTVITTKNPATKNEVHDTEPARADTTARHGIAARENADAVATIVPTVPRKDMWQTAHFTPPTCDASKFSLMGCWLLLFVNSGTRESDP